MGNGIPFPEWERARKSARPEDESQERLVTLLEQPIDTWETKKLAVRKKALQDLADSLPQTTAARMHQRLANPGDPLGQFMQYELSNQLRDDIVRRLGARVKIGTRGTDQQQRGTQKPQQPDKRSTSTSSICSGGVFPLLFGPPAIIPFPGVTSPQYFPNGFPPAGICGRPVLLVPQTYPPAPTQKEPPPPPPKPKPKPKPDDKDKKDKEDKDDKDKKPRKKRPPPSAPRAPDIIGWLSDALSNSASAAMMVGGLLLVLPGAAVAAAIAAATAVIGGGGSAARAGEVAAEEVLKWLLEDKGLDPRHVFDLNGIRPNFPGIDLITPDNPYQIKTYAIDSTRSKLDVARGVVSEMFDLYGGRKYSFKPDTTARALIKSFGTINDAGAWPRSWPMQPTLADLADLKVKLRNTVFGVPDDLVIYVRNSFGSRLVEEPALRELFPELRLGNNVALKTLSRVDQAKWAEKANQVVLSRVTGIGVTSDQLRTMVDAAREIAIAP